MGIAQAQAQTNHDWTRTSAGTWNTAGNWLGGVPVNNLTTDIAHFNRTGVTVTVNASQMIAGLSFGSSAGTYTLTNSSKQRETLTLGSSGIVNTGNSDQIITGGKLQIALGANSSFVVNGTGDLTLSQSGEADTNIGAHALTLGGSGSGIGYITSMLTGTSQSSVTKTGSGTWVLSGSNTYSFFGGVSIEQGTLRATSGGALGSAGNVVTLAGGTLDLAMGTSAGGDSGVNNYNVAVAADSRIVAGRSGSGGGVTHTLGNLTINSQTLTVDTGTGVTSGTGNVVFDTTTVNGNATINVNSGGSAATTLTLGTTQMTGAATSDNTLTLNPGANSRVVINGAVTDATSSYNLSLSHVGNGTVRLNAANNYWGNTQIGTAGGSTNGVLEAGADGILPTVRRTSTVTIYSGSLALNGYDATIYGQLYLGGGAAGTTSSISTGLGTLTLNDNVHYSATNNANGATISGNVAMASGTHAFYVENSTNAADDLTVAATLSGAAGIDKYRDGTMVLSGSNTHTLATTVQEGILNIRNSGALGTTAGATNVSEGATLQLQGGINIVGETLTLSGLGVGSSGALQSMSGNNSWTGAVNLSTNTRIQTESGQLTISGGLDSTSNVNVTVGGAGTTHISGAIGENSFTTIGVNKVGSGTLILSGGSFYEGATNISEGVVSVQSSRGLGRTNGGTTVASGAALYIDNAALGGGTAALTVYAEPVSISGSGVSVAGVQSGALHNVSGSNTFQGNVTVSGLGANLITARTGSSLVMSGHVASTTNSSLTVGSANHTGNIVMSKGLNLGTGSLTKEGSGILSINGGGTTGNAALSGGQLQVGSANLTVADFTASSGTSLLIASGGTLTVTGDATFNNGTLNNLSAGTLQLFGNNTVTFLGSNTASDLTLRVGGDASGAITLFLGAGVTIGSLEITGNTILDFGNSGGTVLSSTNLTIASGATVQVRNWISTTNAASDIWYALSNLNGRPLGSTNDTSAPLDQITFDGYPGLPTTWVVDTSSGWWNHEIRPTPEPGTYGAILISSCLGFIGWRRFRRSRAARFGA